ncbi:oxygenase MpaB family protein [Arthrobacter sp. NPDC058130]|uniref:oxygenase MpaB family protein n=1 Tax=Arthrobacter sp. NPDC058130 TaxID=3346353 RepID=UPI0036EAD236
MLTHRSRRDGAAPDADSAQVYRDMVLYTFATEIRAGFFIAYYRNFAIPSIARTLASRGETAARPMKRSYDTGIVIHELIVNGFDSERGQKMLDLLRRVHQGVPGSGEDFLYPLMTLLVIPLRWIDAHGWRQLTDGERDAALEFYTELGVRMGLDPVPATYAEAAAFMDDYESRNLAASPEGAELLNATAAALAVRLPGPLKSKTTAVIALLMDKPEIVPALGLKPAPAWLRRVFHALLKVRAIITRALPVSSRPSFTPGTSGSSVYPDGYKLEDLGPRSTR